MAKLAHFDASLFIYDFPHSGLICREDGKTENCWLLKFFTNNGGDIELK